MEYPYCLLESSTNIFPVCGDALAGIPLYVDMSYRNLQIAEIEVGNQQAFQEYIDRQLARFCCGWGLSGYLEKRSSLLRHVENMVNEQRYYHLGLDIIAPIRTALYAPIDGEVIEAGFEEGMGAYGGYLILRHKIAGCTFYSLYGHLDPDSLAVVGRILGAGDRLGVLGDLNHNGEWFVHTHLQVITERGRQAGYFSKGYCSAEVLEEIKELCPSPLHLFRY